MSEFEARRSNDPASNFKTMVTKEKEEAKGIFISTERLIGIIIVIAGFFIGNLIKQEGDKRDMAKDIKALEKDIAMLQQQRKEDKEQFGNIEAQNAARYEKLNEKLTEIREIVIVMKPKR